MSEALIAGVLFGSIACLIGALVLVMRLYPLSVARPGCPFCEYDLSGLDESGACPECGQLAEARREERKAQASARSVLLIPLLLGLAAEGAMLVGVAVGTRDFGWAVVCVLIAAPPHVVSLGIVCALRRRLTYRAAGALMACMLLAVTPPLTAACIEFHNPRDAMAGVGVFFAMGLDLLLIPVAMLVGAAVIRVGWFKERRRRPPGGSWG
jgi:hypothetical protein